MTLTAWGRLRTHEASISEPASLGDLVAQVSSGQRFLGLGLARSYGDVGTNGDGLSISSGNLNKMVSFDSESGLLTCEAGVTLRDIQQTFCNRGFMLPVTPGTSFVTVGGAIANDVHGKNHHFAGTFGEHVVELQLVRSDGSITTCSPSQNEGLFRATIGGLGLTGFIARATIRLARVAGGWVETETIAYGDLGEFFSLADESEAEWQSTVSWFDCSTRKAGRGSFLRGNPSASVEPLAAATSALAVPIVPPISLINKLSLDAFNVGYYHLKKATSGKARMNYREFYYPLDSIQHWNRIYGPKGFYQYQSVVPRRDGAEVTKEMLRIISQSGAGSFLGVLKTFGDKQPAGLLSFARAGVTLALDFPNRGEATEKLFAKLDAIVSEAGGCLNPSKDARMSRQMFEQGFTRLSEFGQYRDPNIASDFSRRVID